MIYFNLYGILINFLLIWWIFNVAEIKNNKLLKPGLITLIYTVLGYISSFLISSILINFNIISYAYIGNAYIYLLSIITLLISFPILAYSIKLIYKLEFKKSFLISAIIQIVLYLWSAFI